MLAGTVLDRVSSINDLVVIMDEKMNFLEHVDYQKTLIHVLGSSEAGIRQLCMEPIL
jgi:hypothetical protein